jgi:ABC-type sugar transport system ATPase subunit
MIEELVNTQGQLLTATKELGDGLAGVQRNQLDQLDVWKKYTENALQIAKAVEQLAGLQRFFESYRDEMGKQHDVLFAEVRSLHKEKVSHVQLRIYAAIILTVAGTVGGGMAWMFSEMLKK